MADIVNLSRFKKAKLRNEDAKTADANRIKFGRTKSEKLLLQKQHDLAQKKLDAHKREPE